MRNRLLIPALAFTLGLLPLTARPATAQGPAPIPAAVPCIDLSGKWAGSWCDTGTGHHGPLMAKVRKIDDCRYHATFTGTFRKVIPFVYAVDLTVTGYDGDRVLLTGTHRSALTGRCYRYTAWATNCEFHMDFNSDRYNGHFELTRKR